MAGNKPDIWTDSPVAKEYMRTELVTFRPDQDSWEALDLMLDKGISGAPVVNDEGELVGLLSEKDLLALMAKGSPLGLPKKRVHELMISSVVTIPPDMNVFTVASLFRHNPYRRLPVVEEGKLVGQISRRDLLRCMKDIGKL